MVVRFKDMQKTYYSFDNQGSSQRARTRWVDSNYSADRFESSEAALAIIKIYISQFEENVGYGIEVG
jgi:hypothetical protein